MLRDVFYYGQKPNVHPREKPAKNLEDARAQSTTDHFWIVNEFCDYTNFDWDFDFDFLPDDQVYTEQHNNVWPSQHCKDSDTWLCNKNHSDIIIYREDVPVIKRKNIKTSHWQILEKIDENRFDFSWHPDPTSPPYIYRFGCKYYPATHKAVLEYHVPGATNVKYMDIGVELLPDWDKWKILHEIDKNSFDFSWRPDPTSPPYIYVWGNQHHPGTEMPTIEYHVTGATERNYIDNVWKVKLKSDPDKFKIYEEFTDFDYSWVPHPNSPPYIYVWGNQWNKAEDKASVTYTVEGATEYKYMDKTVIRKANKTNWIIPNSIDDSSFDYSWEPNPHDPPYIYMFGTQHQRSGGPKYVVENATEIKFIDIMKVKRLPVKDKFNIIDGLDVIEFDYSWHPDETEEPFIYVFGNQHYSAEEMPTVTYTVEGATEYKYINNIKAKLGIKSDYWQAPENVDLKTFDFDWIPHPKDEPYIYEFGTQWQKTGGPRYVVPGATEVKYVSDRKAVATPTSKNWKIAEGLNIEEFDYSWHPDSTEKPYIYIFGNQYYTAEVMPTVQYIVPGATEVKYIHTISAKLGPNFNNWVIPEFIDTINFNFSWIPNPHDPPYIYEFGTQHQSNGGPRYVMPGATEIKYVGLSVAKALPNKVNYDTNTTVNVDLDNFDYSWHPDNTEEPYIYQFGTQHQKTGGPRYIVDGATTVKYVTTVKAKALSDKDKWTVPSNLDTSNFDYSWHPDDTDMPYIYEFGTQHQKNGGPKYIVEGATEIKYMISDKVRALSTKDNWNTYTNIKVKKFDYSWHPDNTEEPYIYVFGNQYYSAEIMPTIEYRVPGATQIKYINTLVATIRNDRSKWTVPKDIAVENFDFDWIPNPHDPPYIYEFSTQWQKTGGPRYVVEGATEVKYIKSDDVKRLPSYDNWIIPDNIDRKSFDFSWHPDSTADKPYIYQFGTQWQKTGGPRYVVPGATEVKYVSELVAKRLPDKTNYIIPDNIDDSFDYSWHPDDTEEPYKYEFATVWNDRGGPVYVVKGATEYKYITEIQAKLKPNKQNFVEKIPVSEFDYSWVPHPQAPPYIYVFGNQWNNAETETTLEYVVPGATEKKYVNDMVAKVKPDKTKFEILHPIVEDSFDFSWRPNPYDDPYIYVFGNNQYPGTIMPTVKYVAPNATQTKYVDTIVAKLANNMKNWVELIPVDKNKFDFSWMPDPNDPPYIYVFGNQWNIAAVEPTLEYHVPGATEKKYIEDKVATVLPDKSKFTILHPIIEDSFDFSWRPNPKEDPYIYAWGNNYYPAEKMPTVIYKVRGAVDYKYDNTMKAVLSQNYERYTELIPVDRTSFDYSWVPDPHDPPYIYVFGNQWNDSITEPTLEYRIEGATERKYMDIRAKVLPDYSKWKELIKIRNTFDYSWRPNPHDEPYIYVFGNQWHRAEVEPTIEYHVAGATQRKYISNIIAEVASNMSNWYIPKGINTDDFDFSWRPEPGAPKYIYQFGTLADDEDGPRYQPVDNNSETVKLLRVYKQYSEEKTELPKYYINTTLDDLINEHPDEFFWALNKNINYSNFDFNWRPSIEQARYVQVFGSPEAVETQTYLVSSKLYKQGFTKFNFITQDATVESEEYLAELFIQPDMFMIDRGNSESTERFDKLKERFPTIQKARYLNGWVDTIYRCLNKAKTQLVWILNSELDYSDFNFNYYPNPWQLKMVHVFGTQWSHWGTTYLVNKDTFPEDTKWIKVIEHLSNLNFVKGRIARATNCLYDVYLIDHGNSETETIKQQLVTRAIGKSVHVVSYRNSYLQTFKDIITLLPIRKDHYIWICSSVCEYNKFDFSYICDPFAKDNLHVFPSDKQKFGDTFLVDVNKLRTLIEDMNLLEDYEKVNYNQHQRVKRLQPPVFITEEDTHYKAGTVDFDFPYALFKTYDNTSVRVEYSEPICLWADHTKNIEILTTGGTQVIVPKEVKQYEVTELYDYPYINKSSKLTKSQPLDIVFLSNGETGAEENYQHLLRITKGLPNRIVRVDGIDGRVQAYHAAANASNTPWMFTVFAKLKVFEHFDFSWQPDRLQIPKHYIFNALNPINKLKYGHQAMIAYNKKLTLANTGVGLDFTLDDAHEVLDILSGTANFNTDAYSTWRTAFREVLKLKSDYSDISFERLNTWLNVAEGNYAENCLQGARDAVEYYDIVNGDIDQLRLSYEWYWLKEYYNRKYK